MESAKHVFNTELLESLIELKERRNSNFIAFKFTLPRNNSVGSGESSSSDESDDAFEPMPETREIKVIDLKNRSSSTPRKFSHLSNEEHLAKLRQLEHDHLETIYDSFVFKSHNLFLINEFVGEETLKTRINLHLLMPNPYIELKQILDWVQQLISAVEYLHSNQLAHKNINLNTVYLSRRDNKQRVKLTSLETSEQLCTKDDRLVDLKSVVVIFYQLIVLDETVYDKSAHDLIIKNIRSNLDQANDAEAADELFQRQTSSADEESRSPSPSSLATSFDSSSSSNKLSTKESNMFKLFQDLLDCIDCLESQEGQAGQENNEIINNLLAIKFRQFSALV